jgi:dolichol-phosphate mannosyltransferase
MIKYSIVIPLFNEEENINVIFNRIQSSLKKTKEPYEVIFVNDGSTDNTRKLLEAIHKQQKHFKVLNFSRNFGHQTAVSAGLKYVRGDYIAILDGDLQDPPEVLPDFFKKLKEGFDVVYAVRRRRKEPLIKRIMYAAFYRVLKAVANISIPLDSGDFCVMTKRVANTINSLPERNRFVRGLRSWVGYRQVGLEYEREERFAGNSKYSFAKLFKLAFDGIVSFSYVPLQIVTMIGFFMFLLSIVGSVATVYFKLFTDVYIPRGFPTTIIVIMFIGGVNMLSLGIIGEYIGRIYDEAKQRVPFVIESTLGFKDSTNN